MSKTEIDAAREALDVSAVSRRGFEAAADAYAAALGLGRDGPEGFYPGYIIDPETGEVFALGTAAEEGPEVLKRAAIAYDRADARAGKAEAYADLAAEVAADARESEGAYEIGIANADEIDAKAEAARFRATADAARDRLRGLRAEADRIENA